MIYLFFCLLLHRLAVKISLPFHIFLTSLIVLIQVYNWEIRHHSLLLWTFWHFIHFEFFSPICDRILNGVPLDCREILIKNWFGTKKKKKINTNLRSNERSHLRGHVNQFIDVLLIFPTVSFCALHGCAHVTVLFGDDSDLAYSCARRWAGLHFGKPLSLHLLQGKHQQSLKAASIPCLRIWSTCYCVFLCGRRL